MAVQEPSPRTAATTATTADSALPLKDAGLAAVLTGVLTLPLELVGAELIEVFVASNTIVEAFNVIEDF